MAITFLATDLAMRPALFLLFLGILLSSLFLTAVDRSFIADQRLLDRPNRTAADLVSNEEAKSLFSTAEQISGLQLSEHQLSEHQRSIAQQMVGVKASNESLQYDQHIRPILARKCWACHGPDQRAREADLRLDTREGMTALLPSGGRAVVPGDPEASQLYQRIISPSSDLVMPPAEFHQPLAQHEIELLQQWILEGAAYQSHWAFQSLRPVPLTPAEPSGHLAVRKYQHSPVSPAGQLFTSAPAEADPRSSQAGLNWGNNPIDYFVFEKLQEQGLKPNPPADIWRLIRRVTLDLTGLPPDYQTVQRLRGNWTESTYSTYVDSLLASPAYGERMAALWLAAARYADTNGYQHDNGREMWPWRDWVIRAFNQNMPFDRFAIEQLAGDLLPDAGVEQLIATGFNRNHGLNFEGGSIDAESQCDYVIDRTNTFGTVFLGLTLGCAQCHDHKSDPISQTDYYGLFAFFNTIEEQGFAGEKGNAEPLIELDDPDREIRIDLLQAQLLQLNDRLQQMLDTFDDRQSAWEQSVAGGETSIDAAPADPLLHFSSDNSSGLNSNLIDGLRSFQDGLLIPIAPESLNWQPGPTAPLFRFDGSMTVDLGNIADFEADQPFSFGAWINSDHIQAAPILGRAMFHGFDLVWENGLIRANFVHRWDNNAIFVRTQRRLDNDRWYHVMVTYDGTAQAAGVQVYIDGRPAEKVIDKDSLTGSIKTVGNLYVAGRNDQPGERFCGMIHDVRVYQRELTAVEVAQLADSALITQLLSTAARIRGDNERRLLREYYLLKNVPDYKQLRSQISQVRSDLAIQKNRRLTSMVMREMSEPRVTRRLNRGRYDSPAEVVTARIPLLFPPLLEEQKADRLALAQWLVSSENPLTARVVVNRQWQIFFGRGIVASSDDFGVQGTLPTHPKLLDWLAGEFIASGWDIKRLHRLIVTSATYRQSSTTASPFAGHDPENLWLSRFPRRRLPPEMIRDQLLAASGLGDFKLGGPSVMPPQPEGLWDDVSFKSGFSAQEYMPSQGGDLFRRSIYTYWKRTCPPPNMIVFDAAERSVCSVMTQTSNTPLQALVLLNDPCFVEPAIYAAQRIASRGCVDSSMELAQLFELLLARTPSHQELEIFNQLAIEAQAHWTDSSARQFLSENAANLGWQLGEPPTSLSSLAPIRICVLATVAQVILSMDESLTIH